MPRCDCIAPHSTRNASIRAHRRGAPRGEGRCSERDQCKETTRNGDGWPFDRADPEELRLNQATQSPSAGERDSRSGADHDQDIAHDQPNRAGARPAKSDADANLLRPIRDD
jgi:hypothetical protein